MKNIFYLIIFATSFNLSAQITKGNWLVGGTGDFNTTKTTTSSNGIEQELEGLHFGLAPNMGYFLTDKLATGLIFSFSFNNPSGRDNSNTSLQIGPFVRYYFLPTDKLINAFGELNYTYGKADSKNGVNTSSNNYNIKAGSVLFFNNSVGLELFLNYNINQLNSDSVDLDTKKLMLGIGFQIHLEK